MSAECYPSIHEFKCLEKELHYFPHIPHTSIMYLTFVDLQMRKPIKAIKRRHLERMSGGLAVVAVSPRDQWAIVLISILNYILRTT